MEAWPATALIMPEPDFLLEVLVIALDAPAHLGKIDEISKGSALIKRREPILCGLFLPPRPFDQKGLFRTSATASGR